VGGGLAYDDAFRVEICGEARIETCVNGLRSDGTVRQQQTWRYSRDRRGEGFIINTDLSFSFAASSMDSLAVM